MLLEEIGRVRRKISKQFETLMTPYLDKLDEALSPGLSVVQWLSLDIGVYIASAKKTLSDLEVVVDRANSIHEHRIEAAFAEMLRTPMCVAPGTETLTAADFEAATADACKDAGKTLGVKSEVVRSAVEDVVSLLLRPVGPLESLWELSPAKWGAATHEAPQSLGASMSRAATPGMVATSRAPTPGTATPGGGAHPGTSTPGGVAPPGSATMKRRQTLHLKMKQEAEHLIESYEQRNADTLVQLARTTLETLRRRVAVGGAAYRSLTSKESGLPLFQADIVLNIPSLGMKPPLDEIQQVLNRAVQSILGAFKAVSKWNFDSSGRVGVADSAQPQHSYHRLVAENKEVAKLVSGLSSAVNSTRSLVAQKIDYFKKYQELWTEDREQHMKRLGAESTPSVNEYRLEMQRFAKMEELIQNEEGAIPAGVVVLGTGNLKVSLGAEAKAWLVCYGRAMKGMFEATVDQVSTMTEDWSKRLGREIRDLDDVREVMTVLKEMRENEFYVESSLEPVEVRGISHGELT